jgi:SAM-dependent methyltransferase
LLDLGGIARDWLGADALADWHTLTVLPPAGDPARRTAGPAPNALRAAPECLPFADAAFDAVVVAGVLEHARDDLDALDEIARVLRPGGTLVFRTPRAGRLAWLDPYNVLRYASDAVGRRSAPSESGELGWRRHYPADELRALLAVRGLAVRRADGAGLGLAEGLILSVLLVCRLALRSERAERVARRFLRPLLRAEGSLAAGRVGYDVVLVAERVSARLADSAGDGHP